MNDKAAQADAGTDVVQLLTRQHRQVEAMLKALTDSENPADRAALLARAADELAVHIGAEESVVYPAVRAARTEDILLESLEEHLSLKRLVADLLALAPAEATFRPKCKVLQEQSEHHHKEEEEHLFPTMNRLLDASQRERLGRAVLDHEAQLRSPGAPREVVAEQTDAAQPLTGGDAAA